MFRLEKLQTIVKKRKTIGRGGSRGGTSGKGHKGQKARSGGYVRAGFEGGQMPLIRRLPKRGFTNAEFKQTFEIVSLSRIAEVFENGATVTKDVLAEKGLVHLRKSVVGDIRIKVLGGEPINKQLIIYADAFSKSAMQQIKDSGGEARLNKEM